MNLETGISFLKSVGQAITQRISGKSGYIAAGLGVTALAGAAIMFARKRLGPKVTEAIANVVGATEEKPARLNSHQRRARAPIEAVS